MPRRKVYDTERHLQFVTFSCYKRRRLLDPDICKRLVIGTLGSQLAQQRGHCVGFVVMPDHVHCLLWFEETGELVSFIQVWKQRASVQIKRQYSGALAQYATTISPDDPVWTSRFYPFNVFTDEKVEEKLNYMHQNPERAGLVSTATDWLWSSARWYKQRKWVGLPISWPL